MTAAAELYLDTARLGRMSRSAQWAVRDFARLAGEAALTLYGKNFLFDGYEILPERIKRRCDGLRSWRGVESLKRELLTLVNARPDRDCVLASRSLTILQLSAQLLSQSLQASSDSRSSMATVCRPCRESGEATRRKGDWLTTSLCRVFTTTVRQGNNRTDRERLCAIAMRRRIPYGCYP